MFHVNLFSEVFSPGVICDIGRQRSVATASGHTLWKLCYNVKNSAARAAIHLMPDFRCHALDVGNRGAVKAERAVRIPFQDFHDADTANVIGVLSRKFFSVVETRSQHDINSNRAIGCRPGKKDSSRPVLILQPLPVLREMELFVFFLLGQGTRKHQVPHAFLF